MRRRVEEVLDALGLAHVRHRPPGSLSGGEKQRCAIAGALAAGPAVLVLDEPTSQLDPQGAEDVLGALGRLNADLGTTIVIAEHRLERAAPMADRVCVLRDGSIAIDDAPGRALASYPGAPPVTHLGRFMHWDPPPLTVKDARQRVLADHLRVSVTAEEADAAPGEVVVRVDHATVVLDGQTVVGPVTLEVGRGEVVALLGRNGAGKTTLLRAMAGLVTLGSGATEARAPLAYVPQDPNSLLFSPTARREVGHTLRLLGQVEDRAVVDRWLALLGLDAIADRHPRTLSGGERQRLAVAAVAIGGAPGLLLDETTRGMDAPSRTALETAIREHTARGGLVVLATHDVELAARVATRVVVLGDGEVVADGPARAVLAGSLFAPQMMRVLPPALTVDEVAKAILRNAAP
jgi:energy-coupling factor transport system ATP-binding protein